MEVLLVDVHHDQFEQAEDGEQEGDEPGQLGDQLKGVSLFLENPNHWLDGQVNIKCSLTMPILRLIMAVLTQLNPLENLLTNS